MTVLTVRLYQPVLVEASSAFFIQVLGPYCLQCAGSSRSVNVSHNANYHQGRSFQHCDGFHHLFLMYLCTDQQLPTDYGLHAIHFILTISIIIGTVNINVSNINTNPTVAAWNKLPTDIRNSSSLGSFQSRLKSHLFCAT